MDELKVREIMTTNVITVKPDTTVGELADILTKNKISGVPVVDGQGRVLGMVSEADIILQDADLHFPYYIQFLDMRHLPAERPQVRGARPQGHRVQGVRDHERRRWCRCHPTRPCGKWRP